MREQQALVVDDHPIIRDSIKQLLVRAFPALHIRDSSGTDRVLEEICSYRGRLSRWISISLVRMVFLIIREIQGCCPTVPIIVFQPLFRRPIRSARFTGRGRRIPVKEVTVGVGRGCSVRPAGRKRSRQPAAPVLSSRLNEVLALLGKGMNRQQIAHELGISGENREHGAGPDWCTSSMRA